MPFGFLTLGLVFALTASGPAGAAARLPEPPRATVDTRMPATS